MCVCERGTLFQSAAARYPNSKIRVAFSAYYVPCMEMRGRHSKFLLPPLQSYSRGPGRLARNDTPGTNANRCTGYIGGIARAPDRPEIRCKEPARSCCLLACWLAGWLPAAWVDGQATKVPRYPWFRWDQT